MNQPTTTARLGAPRARSASSGPPTSRRRLRTGATLVAAVGICFLVSACHSAASAGAATDPALPNAPVTATLPDTTTPDAPATAGAAEAGGCLISPQEASTAFGHSAGAGSGDATTCTYQTSAGILTVFATGYGDNATAAFTAQRQAAMGVPGFQDIDNVGDRAFVKLAVPTSQIEFVKGSSVVTIQLGISPAPSVAVLTTLGQAAASRV